MIFYFSCYTHKYEGLSHVIIGVFFTTTYWINPENKIKTKHKGAFDFQFILYVFAFLTVYIMKRYGMNIKETREQKYEPFKVTIWFQQWEEKLQYIKYERYICTYMTKFQINKWRPIGWFITTMNGRNVKLKISSLIWDWVTST